MVKALLNTNILVDHLNVISEAAPNFGDIAKKPSASSPEWKVTVGTTSEFRVRRVCGAPE
jgi:hypothetical protein